MIRRLKSSNNEKKRTQPRNVWITRDLRPRVYLEEPRKLSFPIVINHYRNRVSTTVNRATGNKGHFKEKAYDVCPTRNFFVCKWIRKKKALKQLKAEKEQDRKRLRFDSVFREQKAREYEDFQRFYKEQAEQNQIIKEQKASIAKVKKDKVPKEKVEKVKVKREKVPKEKVEKVKVKKEKVKKEKPIKKSSKEYEDFVETDVLAQSRALEREKVYRVSGSIKSTTTTKPRAASKSVSVKKYNRHSTLTERFVNACYRFCCQFYCHLTILLLIGFAIVLFI